MSDKLATYTFLPWLRQGIVNELNTPGAGETRATVDVNLDIQADLVAGGTSNSQISQQIQIYGPGDIIGIDKKAIIKEEPRNYITNFEANYFPYIDFYDEDYAWRYTPEQPDANNRLRPWITLVVLKEDEFEDGSNLLNRPLPFIKVSNAATAFPPGDQLWAWAHVHVNEGLDDPIISNNQAKIANEMAGILASNPDLAYCRILCPRKLEPSAAYHAFLVPTYETGRLAGLGLDPGLSPNALQIAWDAYSAGLKTDPEFYPYYHRWYFRTGTLGDFEYLVRLLVPKPMDHRVGTRDMDVQKPGSNISGIDQPELEGILKLGGALRIPFDTLQSPHKEIAIKYDEWAKNYPVDFQKELAAFVNLPDDYESLSAEAANTDAGHPNDPDPLITAPIYGRWHALATRLLKEQDGTDLPQNQNWLHDLNLDPRFRVAAGIGTGVVQDNQEEYMKAAWEQIGDVLEANNRIRLAQLAKEVSFSWYNKHLQPLRASSTGTFLAVAAPMQKRVLAEGLTVYHQFKTSVISRAPVSTAMRKVIAPRGRIVEKLNFDKAPEATIRPDNLIERINEGQITAAPPKVVPAGVATVDDIADALQPKNVPDFIADLLKKYPWIKWIPLVLAILLLIILFFLGVANITWGIGAAIAIGLIGLYRLLNNWEKAFEQAESISESAQTPDSVDDYPSSPDWQVTFPGDGIQPTIGETDSPEAIRFKGALKDSFNLIQVTASASEVPPLQKLNLTAIANTTFDKINPNFTIPKRTFQGIFIPARILQLMKEEFVEAMAYPVIDLPMYKPLVEKSDELFLPNINFVTQNSISLLETNQRFIESYMVGLNHEFARELLWREYVTDQRGSYFRQFWDVSSFLADRNEDPEVLKEKMRDIPPLDTWSKFSNLGDHDNREQGNDNEEELVLVIRGELLKKYPTAVIYAQRAKWQLDDQGNIDNKRERQLVDISDSEEDNPPTSKIKTPLYEAKVDPDIYFFGFDLTAKEAKGGKGDNPNDDPGWFFVIKERPGEPRFGLDIDNEGDIDVWNDLSWPVAAPGLADGGFLQINAGTQTIEVTPPEINNNEDETEKVKQHEDDVFVTWNKDMHAAELAYILYQVPVLVGVHAAEMLPR
ncbi:MAG: hypothetical protein KDC34_09795 [Saprospiraceae bacterium]|nr:hypothetical protein [Saprospiraceae bacterium]